MSGPAHFEVPVRALIVTPEACEMLALGLTLALDEFRRLSMTAPPGARELLAAARAVAAGKEHGSAVVPRVASAGSAGSSWLDVKESSARLGCSETLVRRWCRQGRLVAVKDGAESWRVDPDSVEERAAWLADNGKRAKS
jgi:excisionase family DNA binding protein